MIRRPRTNRNQQGYALLVVLFLGAVMAITLALSLPRAAFEAQRAKEEDLVYRGSQYARAVRLYFRKNKVYPPSLENLEKHQNIRFLRKKYIDPITKKEEWRIIHIGPAGVFTDSLLYDKPKPKKEGEPDSPSGSATASPIPTPGTPGTDAPITGMADRLRAGVNPQPGQTQDQFGQPPNPGGVAPPNPGQPVYYNVGGQPQQVAQPGQPQPGQPGQPGVQLTPGAYPGMTYPGNPQFRTAVGAAGTSVPGGFPATPPPPGTPPYPGQLFPQPNPGQPSYPGQPYPGQPYPGQPMGSGPVGYGGQQPNSPFNPTPGVGNQAASLIGSLLSAPRPGGLPGIQPGTAQPSAFGTPAGGTTFGGGIAGVASKSEARGIKVFKDRENYNEWEFIYDYRQDPLLVGTGMAMGAGMQGQAGLQGQPGIGQQTGMQGQTGFGQTAGFGQAGFGQTAGFGQPGVGQNAGFGQPGFGQPSAFGQPGFGQQTPINPAQPGLPGSPLGQPGAGTIIPGAPVRR